MVNLHYLVILNIIVIILTSLRCMRMDIEENAGMPKHEKKEWWNWRRGFEWQYDWLTLDGKDDCPADLTKGEAAEVRILTWRSLMIQWSCVDGCCKKDPLRRKPAFAVCASTITAVDTNINQDSNAFTRQTRWWSVCLWVEKKLSILSVISQSLMRTKKTHTGVCGLQILSMLEMWSGSESEYDCLSRWLPQWARWHQLLWHIPNQCWQW